MPDFALELTTVREIASLTGWNISNIRPGPDAQGIDVLFEVDGRRVGAQHTTFHSDEGDAPGVRGSPTRAKEERKARATDTAFGICAKFNYRPALRLRVDEKIGNAAEHDNDEIIDETWLVISANVGKWGAAASTMIAARALRSNDLNALCHAELAASPFECACLVLHMDGIVWGWDRPGGWRVIADPGAQARDQHGEQMRDLIFNRIAADFCGRWGS